MADGRRPPQYWADFNAWARELQATAGRRPRIDDLEEWWSANSKRIWPNPNDRPTFEEARRHAKGVRTKDDMKLYFREYRARRKREDRPVHRYQKEQGRKGPISRPLNLSDSAGGLGSNPDMPASTRRAKSQRARTKPKRFQLGNGDGKLSSGDSGMSSSDDMDLDGDDDEEGGGGVQDHEGLTSLKGAAAAQPYAADESAIASRDPRQRPATRDARLQPPCSFGAVRRGGPRPELSPSGGPGLPGLPVLIPAGICPSRDQPDKHEPMGRSFLTVARGAPDSAASEGDLAADVPEQHHARPDNFVAALPCPKPSPLQPQNQAAGLGRSSRGPAPQDMSAQGHKRERQHSEAEQYILQLRAIAAKVAGLPLERMSNACAWNVIQSLFQTAGSEELPPKPPPAAAAAPNSDAGRTQPTLPVSIGLEPAAAPTSNALASNRADPITQGLAPVDTMPAGSSEPLLGESGPARDSSTPLWDGTAVLDAGAKSSREFQPANAALFPRRQPRKELVPSREPQGQSFLVGRGSLCLDGIPRSARGTAAARNQLQTAPTSPQKVIQYEGVGGMFKDIPPTKRRRVPGLAGSPRSAAGKDAAGSPEESSQQEMSPGRCVSQAEHSLDDAGDDGDRGQSDAPAPHAPLARGSKLEVNDSAAGGTGAGFNWTTPFKHRGATFVEGDTDAGAGDAAPLSGALPGASPGGRSVDADARQRSMGRGIHDQVESLLRSVSRGRRSGTRFSIDLQDLLTGPDALDDLAIQMGLAAERDICGASPSEGRDVGKLRRAPEQAPGLGLQAHGEQTPPGAGSLPSNSVRSGMPASAAATAVAAASAAAGLQFPMGYLPSHMQLPSSISHLAGLMSGIPASMGQQPFYGAAENQLALALQFAALTQVGPDNKPASLGLVGASLQQQLLLLQQQQRAVTLQMLAGANNPTIAAANLAAGAYPLAGMPGIGGVSGAPRGLF